MSIKSKVLASAAAASVIAGGVGMAAATANASTPSCGHSCVDIFGAQWGRSNPIDSFKQGSSVGTKVILFHKNNSDPGQDFTISEQGTVSDFYALGLVSPQVDLHYSADQAYEIQYAPYGRDTGLCVGTGSTASNGTAVTLQWCGVSSKTVWIKDTANGRRGFTPLINGSDTNFSDPYVLTYSGSAAPTDMPRPGLFTWHLSTWSRGMVDSTQLWKGL
jgi:hypothetical protein